MSQPLTPAPTPTPAAPSVSAAPSEEIALFVQGVVKMTKLTQDGAIVWYEGQSETIVSDSVGAAPILSDQKRKTYIRRFQGEYRGTKYLLSQSSTYSNSFFATLLGEKAALLSTEYSLNADNPDENVKFSFPKIGAMSGLFTVIQQQVERSAAQKIIKQLLDD